MSTFIGQVNFDEALSIKVGRTLLACGYVPADSSRYVLKNLVRDNSLGILYKDPDARVWHFLGIFPIKPRRIFLGTIWFNDKERGASEQKWFLEAYGSMYADIVESIAKKLANTFEVDITIQLISDQAVRENSLP
jgi:hypothetical protein